MCEGGGGGEGGGRWRSHPLFMKVVASWGMAPMARNMMLRKDTPKMDREPVAVFLMPENSDPMTRDMMTTWISLEYSR